jgi:hypothetical protein
MVALGVAVGVTVGVAVGASVSAGFSRTAFWASGVEGVAVSGAPAVAIAVVGVATGDRAVPIAVGGAATGTRTVAAVVGVAAAGVRLGVGRELVHAITMTVTMKGTRIHPERSPMTGILTEQFGRALWIDHQEYSRIVFREASMG